jgi:hypothetical protein
VGAVRRRQPNPHVVALAGIAIWYAHIEVEALFEQMAAKSLVARSVTRLSLQDQRTRGSSH